MIDNNINNVESETIPNTGNYKWTIPSSISGSSVIGVNESIRIMAVNSTDGYNVSGISNNFTIEN